jgi:uncharacterized membrane protein
MTFLNPAVLFGLIAASIPVLIHLLNLRKLKKIEFSTLMFLKELQKNKIRKIKLKQWLLLALRVLIILFLVTAFARPTLKGVAIGGTASTAKTTAVFIIDNTFSMEVVDAHGSYFNQAKSIAIQLLNQLQEGDEAAVIPVSGISTDDLKASGNLAEIKKQIDELTVSPVSGTLNNSIINAAKVLGLSKNFNKEIYIISDFQKSGLKDEKGISNLSELLNDKVRIYSFPFPQKDVYNIGIDNIKLNTQIFQKDKTISVSAFVTNYSDKAVDNVVVSLFIQGERTAQKSIELKSRETKEVPLESVIKYTGNQEVFAEIEDDELIKDNRRFTNFYVPEKLPVLIITGSNEDSRYVELALKADDNNNFMQIDKKSPSQLSTTDLSKYEAIITIGSEGINNPLRLIDYLKTGGGLFIMPGSKSSLSSFQIFCNELKIPMPKTFINLSGTNNKANFFSIDYQHPLFTNLFSDKNKNKIESPDIYSYFQIFTEGKGKNIIGFNDYSSFLSEYRFEKGKILLMSSAPGLSAGNFPLKSLFVPLIYKSVFYLSSKDQPDTNLFAGNNIELDVSKYPLKQIKVVKPGKQEEIINLNEDENKNYFVYSNTNETGNYKFYSGEKLVDIVPINTNPKESDLTRMSTSEFKNYLQQISFKGKYIPVNPGENIAKVIKEARYGSELWKFFVIVALALALLEMLVARSVKKDMGETSI